ncbi:hypothetical protein K432DRAFT_472809 [Lepidopterella palustris CBS 459.81]|uniref:CorA-like Mg2+ transporter protein n=1 Tax=Lepidopterella palustris CBS 459.81 TaxID=1314670 RepID=A0A8E2EE46_9PEZI|nr:hypothetical protein K432DRAFT_472809 [Lepidopterella palustris CBS 459.81]
MDQDPSGRRESVAYAFETRGGLDHHIYQIRDGEPYRISISEENLKSQLRKGESLFLGADIVLICLSTPTPPPENSNYFPLTEDGNKELKAYFESVYPGISKVTQTALKDSGSHFTQEYSEQNHATLYSLNLPSPENTPTGLSLLLVELDHQYILGFAYGMQSEKVIDALGLPLHEPWIKEEHTRTQSRMLVASLFRYLGRGYSNAINVERNKFNRIGWQLDNEIGQEVDMQTLGNRHLVGLKTRVKVVRGYMRKLWLFTRAFRDGLRDAEHQLELERDSNSLRPVYSLLAQLDFTLEGDSYEAANLLDEIRELAEQVGKMNEQSNERKREMLQTVLVELTNALKRDSSNMKMIAILTALFLPGTFIAIMLTTPMFKWPDPGEGEIVVWLPFRIYWAVSGSMTLFLGCCMAWLFLFQPRRLKKHLDPF